jgi:hypothetical protein
MDEIKARKPLNMAIENPTSALIGAAISSMLKP